MALTSTLYDKLLKDWYAPGRLQSMLFKQFPLLEKIRKEKAAGRQYVQPVLNGANVRRSASYSFVQNSITEVAPAVAFAVPYQADYATVAINGNTWRQSESDVGSFIAAFKLVNDQAIAALRKSLALKLYRNGTGSVAQLGGSATTATVQALTNRADGFNFEIGDICAFSLTDGGFTYTGLPASTTGAVIAGIQDDGTTCSLVFTGQLNSSVTDVTSSAYIYLNSGDAQNNASTGVVCMGLLGYSPASTASLTVSFYGVTRSTDPRRLRGQFVANTTSAPIDEQLQQGITQLIALGGMPDAIFMNPQDVLNLQKVAGSKVTRSQGGTATIGFKAVTFATASGDITVYSDPACPQGVAFVLEMDGIKLVSMGEPIGVRKQGDSTMVRTATSTDAWLIDWVGYTNLVCERPGQTIATVQL
jgi:hypothetical protein